MKKLMIAAAVVCVAALSQAATSNWTYTQSTVLKDGYTGNGSSSAIMAGQTVYLFAESILSQQGLIDALKANRSYSLATESLASLTTDSAGKNTTGTGFSTDKFGTTAEKFYAATVVDTDADGKYDYVYISAALSKTPYDATKTQTVTPIVSTSTNLREGTTFGSGGWYAVASVPEPTSGLLLLLGVAGLALRRRRA